MEKLLPDGFRLLIIGQASVLSFIGCIVVTIKAIAWVVKRFETPPAAPAQGETVAAIEEDDGALAAAIGAALHKNRTDR